MIELQIIGVCMVISMFFLPRAWKMSLILISTTCFSLVRVPIPGTFLTTVLCYIFLLSEYRYLHKFWKMLLCNRVLLAVLSIQLVATVISYFTSPHYFGTITGTKNILIELFSYNILIAYSFFSFRRLKDINVLLLSSFFALIVLTFFAIVNLLEKQADFVTLAMQAMETNDVTELAGEAFVRTGRFRVQAMFLNPFDYGYICLIHLALHTYGVFKKLENKFIYCVVIFCCAFGILMCACRTVLFCSVAGALCFVVVQYKLQASLKYILIASVVSIIAYFTIPSVKENVDIFIDIFVDTSGGREIEGSNLDMRVLQFVVVLGYIRSDFIFGLGRDYFNIDLGWADGRRLAVDPDLHGLEGIHLNYLLERGVVGFLFWLAFYVVLLRFFWKRRGRKCYSSSMGITVIFVYMLFSLLTGELESLRPTMLLVGMFLNLSTFMERDTRSKRVKMN